MKSALLITVLASLLTGCSMFESSPTAPLAATEQSGSENGLSSGDAVGQRLFSPQAVAARQSQDATATALTD